MPSQKWLETPQTHELSTRRPTGRRQVLDMLDDDCSLSWRVLYKQAFLFVMFGYGLSRACQQHVQSMALGVIAAANAIQQLPPAYKLHVNQDAANNFQKQFASQADSDSESDSNSADAAGNQPAKASNTNITSGVSGRNFESGIDTSLKLNPATVLIKNSQAGSIEAPVIPLPSKSGPTLTGFTFAALPTGVAASEAKHLPPTSKAAAPAKKPEIVEQAQASDSSSNDAEPSEVFTPSAAAISPQSSSSSSPPTDASTATKVGSDSQMSPAGTGEPSHAVEQAPSQNAEDVSFAVRLATETTSSSSPQSGQDTANIQSILATRPITGSNQPTGGGTFRSEAIAVAAPQSSQDKPAFDKLEKAAEPEAVRHDVIERPVEPARYLRLQVSGDGAQQVELRMIEHSGAVNVSVRTTDPALSRSLQEGISELTNRLQADRFHAEVWLPKSAESHWSNAGDSYSSGGRGGAGGERDSNQPGSRKNQSRPEWVDELEQLGKASTGRKNN